MLTVKNNTEIPGVRFLELSGKPTDEDIETYAEYELKRIDSDPHDERVLILVLKEVWSSTQRKRMKDVEKELMRRLKGRNLGMAMVVPNSLLRGTFTAYFWISPPAYPTSAVPTAAAAYDFVVECLRAVDMPIPKKGDFVRVASSEWRTMLGPRIIPALHRIKAKGSSTKDSTAG